MLPCISAICCVYIFLAIGLAFMFMEIAFIQKFVPFLAHPLYAVATVLCAFLVFAAAGSWLTERWQKKMANSRYVTLAVMVMGALSLLYLAILPGLFQALIHLPDAAKIIISMTLITPMAMAWEYPSLGMGDQRLRLGSRGSPCYLTGNSSGVFCGSPGSTI